MSPSIEIEMPPRFCFAEDCIRPISPVYNHHLTQRFCSSRCRQREWRRTHLQHANKISRLSMRRWRAKQNA
jgi:hypothetical protein